MYTIICYCCSVAVAVAVLYFISHKLPVSAEMSLIHIDVTSHMHVLMYKIRFMQHLTIHNHIGCKHVWCVLFLSERRACSVLWWSFLPFLLFYHHFQCAQAPIYDIWLNNKWKWNERRSSKLWEKWNKTRMKRLCYEKRSSQDRFALWERVYTDAVKEGEITTWTLVPAHSYMRFLSCAAVSSCAQFEWLMQRIIAH